MQRSATSTLRRISTRCSSTNADTADILRMSHKIIDRAAQGEAKGPVGNWSFDYQSKSRYAERMARPARLGQRVSALRSNAPNWDELEAEPMDMCNSQLVTPPGTLVEIRRNETAFFGIIIGASHNQEGFRTVTITSEGKFVYHSEQDIMLSIPSYVNEGLAHACGIDEATPTSSQVNARVELLKKIRHLEKAIQDVSSLIYTRAQPLYQNFRSQDPDQWGRVDVSTAAKLVMKSGSVPIPVLFATHKFLMSNSKHFVAHPNEYSHTHAFLVRPQSHIETVDKVTAWMRDRHGGILHAFAAKALKVMSESQRIASESHANPPSLHSVGFQDVAFNEDDLVILRFLYDSFRTARSTQTSPYTIPLTYIIKLLGGNPGSRKTLESLMSIITDLGVLTPWEDTPGVAARFDLLANRPRESVPMLSKPLGQQPIGPDDLYTTDSMESIRHDFGDLPVYVMDDATAEELDDGISIEAIPSDPRNVWVHVHIADPTRILPPTHRVAAEARKIGETMYYNHGSKPMLPLDSAFHSLSLGTSSANGQPEHVLSFSFKVDQAGDIIDYKVRAGLVRNIRVTTYNEVDSILGRSLALPSFPFQSEPPAPDPVNRKTSPLDETHTAELKSLFAVSNRLIQQRNQTESFGFASPKSTVSLLSKALPQSPLVTSQPHFYQGFPAMTYQVNTDYEQGGARAMISEFMKAASRVVSRFGVERGIPLVRRSCQPAILPAGTSLQSLLKTRNEAGFIDLWTALRSNVVIPRAFNTTTPSGHWTLGIPEGEGYVRTTSPLRRYADLVTHWQIKHALLDPNSSKPLLSQEWMSQFCNELTLKERELKRLRTTHESFWAAAYLKRWRDGMIPTCLDPNSTFIAKTSGFPKNNGTGFSSKAIIPQLGIWAELDGKKEFEIGSDVKVRFTDITMGVRPLISVALA